MRYFVFLFFCLLASLTHAEGSLLPAMRFANESQQFSNERVIEFWGYHDYQGSDNYQDTLKLRYYNPLNIGDWQGRIRLDTSIVSSYNSINSSNNSGQYSTGNTMLTVWGQDNYFLKALGASAGGRLIFPFGNNGQWAIGPQLGWIFIPEGESALHLTDISPLLRYMYGFDTKNNSTTINPSQSALARNLQIYPTIGFQLSPNTMLRFWDENGAIYNSAGGGWFVPIDAMVTHRFATNWLFAIGASKQVVQNYQQYDWSTYAKVSFKF